MGNSFQTDSNQNESITWENIDQQRPEPKCKCGKTLEKYQVQFTYQNNSYNYGISCDGCGTSITDKTAIVYHCLDGKSNDKHKDGYDLCIECAEDKPLKFDKLKSLLCDDNYAVELVTDTDEIFCSYLERQSLYLKQFKLNWIMLRQDGKLYCYNWEMRFENETEIIDVKQYKSVRQSSYNQFTLCNDKSTKVFRSANNFLIIKWVNLLTAIINRDINGILSIIDDEDGESKEDFDEDYNALYETAKERGIIDENWGKITYHHKVDEQDITCPNMVKIKANDPSKCPIYHAMMTEDEYSKQNYDHLHLFKHFQNDFTSKQICKYGQECKSYINYEQGTDANNINDKCHMKLYRHPPRTRQIKLAENMKSMILKTDESSCAGLQETRYGMTRENYNHGHCQYAPVYTNKYNRQDGWLGALIEEVISNGYKYDLCLKCSKDDECKHDVYKSSHSILKLVDEKMKHSRHRLMQSPLNRDHMLALILYTGLMLIMRKLCAHVYDITNIQVVIAIMTCVKVKEVETTESGRGLIIVYSMQFIIYQRMSMVRFLFIQGYQE